MLATRILECLTSDDRSLEVIREHAYDTVNNTYTWDKIALLTSHEYQKI